MFSYGDFIRFYCGEVASIALEGEQIQAPVASSGQASSYEDEDDSDDATEHEDEDDSDDAMEHEDQKAFLEYEVKLPSLSTRIYDFDVRDPRVQDRAAKLLSFLETRLETEKLPLPALQHDASGGDSDGLLHEIAQRYTQLAAKNGEHGIRLQEAMRPSTLMECREFVVRFTGLNKTLESRYEQEDINMAADVASNNSTNPTGSLSLAGHHDRLYEVLSDQLCNEPGHQAFLQVSGSGYPLFDMILSGCSDNWLETQFMLDE
ncbi:pfs domain-containing protein [Colletotrichum higginsianum]|nr:pfs domain-containing protein [Colletotrichum higginsianum]